MRAACDTEETSTAERTSLVANFVAEKGVGLSHFDNSPTAPKVSSPARTEWLPLVPRTGVEIN